jgi:hypothetical protein
VRRGRRRFRARSGPFRASFTLPSALLPTLLPLLNALVPLLPTLLPFLPLLPTLLPLLPFLPLVPAFVRAPVVAHVMLLPVSSIA